MATLIFLFLLIFYYILFQRIRSFHKQSLTPLSGTTILLTVIGTQMYDMLVLSLGSVLGEGPLLQALSIPRFFFSAIFMPLLLVTALEFIVRTGVRWVDNKATIAIAWILALGLIAYEFIVGQMTHELAPKLVEGALRYEPAGAGPAVSVIVVAVFFLVAGFFLLARVKWIWTLLASALLMGSLLLPGIPYPALVIAGGKAAFFWALVATESRVLSKPYELEEEELVQRLISKDRPEDEPEGG